MLTTPGQVPIKWNRWLEAQDYERGFWQRLGRGIEEGTTSQLDWYQWRANQLEAQLQSLSRSGPICGKVLEIGSGPIGIVNFLEWGERYAIDPLEPFYRQQPSLIKLRNSGVRYLAGSGEQLPMGDGSVALVIIDNVIDHTYAPGTILREIQRVLEPRGLLYLSVNVHTEWGAILHDVLAVFRIDKGHPYTFTSRTLGGVLRRHGFAIDFEDVENYEQAKRANRRSSRVTDRVKAYTGLSEFQHKVICRKAFAPA
jgi:ubiquinone/menaquinone biosynthesis C-methylase UbiE